MAIVLATSRESLSVEGPYMLNLSALEELDPLLEIASKIINESAIKELEAKTIAEMAAYYKDVEDAKKQIKLDEVRKRIQEVYFKEFLKDITLSDENNTIIKDTSIKGILKFPNLKTFNPQELKIEIKRGYSNKFILNINPRFGGEMKCSIDCFDPDSQEDLFYEVNKWIEKYQPKRAYKVWKQTSFLLVTIGLLVFTLFFSQIVTIPESGDKLQQINRLNQILKTGVNDSNKNAAQLLVSVEL